MDTEASSGGGGGGFFSSLFHFGSTVHHKVNSLIGREGLEVVNPEGSKDDAEVEATKGRFQHVDRESYWKMMHKYIGSDVQSLVTLPVFISEPMTNIQRMAELMEYSYLLDLADQSDDPNVKMVYAVCWAVSVYFAYQRPWKPFNPILGETYEMVNHDGIAFLAEQVSHHPPMSSGHAENKHFTYDVTSKLKTKFLGNSLEIYPLGRTRVVLKRTGEVLDLVPPPSKVHNLIFGRTWVDSPGEMILTNLTTGHKAVLYFQPCGWFGAGRHEVDGYIYDKAEEPKLLVTGKWSTSLSYQPCDQEGEPVPNTQLTEVWKVTEPPKDDKHQYTYFAHKVNNFDTAPSNLLASDSRLRPDRLALEKGDMQKAGSEKTRLEEQQRAEKREREGKKLPFNPRWFRLTEDVHQTPWGDIEIYEYNRNYDSRVAEARPKAVDPDSIVFNPWQFEDVSHIQPDTPVAAAAT